ncbi:MAG: ATP phosphoribosyltransferase regulatory subunit, partial [Bacteroidales bacterium]|nr:ATP phosphoribosyltransferase regulatory subunit [Bacteroidales bacterium]
PQKGRYREFYQCDVDIIGSKSLFNEFELIQIINDVFEKLNISVTLKLNNRKILSGIAEAIGEADKFVAITVAIDKIDKIGLEKVSEELRENGLSEAAIEKLKPILENKGNTDDTFKLIESIIGNTETGKAGIEEMNVIFNYIKSSNLSINVELDLSLARGLNYYTGAIFEVKANDVEIGSICGGGRYDNLTGIFGLKDVSGVGVSFGADRIYDVLTQLGLFPTQTEEYSKVLFVNFGQNEEKACIKLAKELRNNNISCEIFPEKSKLDKQFKYADSHNIPFVVIIGENELNENTLNIKNMKTGEQESMLQSDLLAFLTSEIENL